MLIYFHGNSTLSLPRFHILWRLVMGHNPTFAFILLTGYLLLFPEAADILNGIENYAYHGWLYTSILPMLVLAQVQNPTVESIPRDF